MQPQGGAGICRSIGSEQSRSFPHSGRSNRAQNLCLWPDHNKNRKKASDKTGHGVSRKYCRAAFGEVRRMQSIGKICKLIKDRNQQKLFPYRSKLKLVILSTSVGNVLSCTRDRRPINCISISKNAERNLSFLNSIENTREVHSGPGFIRSNLGFDAPSRPPAAIQMGLSPPTRYLGRALGHPACPRCHGEAKPCPCPGNVPGAT